MRQCHRIYNIKLLKDLIFSSIGQTTKPELSEHLTGNDSANDIRRLGMDELTKREPITSPQVQKHSETYRKMCHAIWTIFLKIDKKIVKLFNESQ